ncbi:hypothetical protein D3C87_64620 [compost metagenome]
MKTILIFLLSVYGMVSFGQADTTSKCITGDGMAERDIELSVGYYQIDRGYFYADVTTSFDIAIGIGFYEPGIRVGYNPWENCGLFQVTQSAFGAFLSYDLYAGWAQNFNSQEGLFFLAPGITFSFKYVDIGYSYSFVFNRSIAGFNPGSNMNIKIPIRSTCGFEKFREKKRWHWGEAHHGLWWF